MTGIQIAHLVSEKEYQPKFFDRPKAQIDVDRIVDEINRRLGDPKNLVVTRASQRTLRSSKGWRMKAERYLSNYITDLSQVPEARA